MVLMVKKDLALPTELPHACNLNTKVCSESARSLGHGPPGSCKVDSGLEGGPGLRSPALVSKPCPNGGQ